MRASRAGRGLALLLIAAVAGCQTPKPREVDAIASGTLVKLARGQELIVSLDANTTPGFRWLVQQRSDSVLTSLGDPTYAARVGDPRLVGTGGITTFKFKAVAPGRETLVFTYRRPWEANLPPAKLVRYEINVE
jgi:inhibitor of cysteine peptidase